MLNDWSDRFPDPPRRKRAKLSLRVWLLIISALLIAALTFAGKSNHLI